MNYVYNIHEGVKRTKTKTMLALSLVAISILILGSVAGFLPAITGATGYSGSSSLYDNIPNPVPGNVASLGFAATSTSEFGGQVELAGSKRKDPTVNVLMSSWACKSGSWNNKNCITNPGSTFNHPVTLNVYEVGDGDDVGDLITSKTQTFTMPYRPTADDGTNCKDSGGAPNGAWWDGSSCYNGKAFTISFDLDDVTLPDQVILAVAYNTSNYGENPLGTQPCNSTPQGCPYDSLNVGTNPTPTVGSALPTVNDAYLDSTWSGAYCDSGTGGTGELRLDAGCWTGFLPAFEVKAKSNGKYYGHGHHYGHNKKSHKNKKDNDRHHGYRGHKDRYSQSFRSFWNR